jgi:hypothetical protein
MIELKMRIRDRKEYPKVQKRLLQQGVIWRGGARGFFTEGISFLYIDYIEERNVGTLTYGCYDEEDLFKENVSVEVTVVEVLERPIKELAKERKLLYYLKKNE